MEAKKLDDIMKHAQLIQKLAGLLPSVNPISKQRINTIVSEAQMIKELTASMKDNSE